jgi:hypothetical protein
LGARRTHAKMKTGGIMSLFVLIMSLANNMLMQCTKLQKIRIDFSFKREVIFFSGYSLAHRFAISFSDASHIKNCYR